MRKALVILSGGQDSTTCLLFAKAAGYDEVHAITFDYGQKHQAELEAARKVAQVVGVTGHYFVNARGMLLGRSPLVNPAAELETYSDFKSMDEQIGNRVELTFVPLRNLFFLIVAANYALSIGAEDIYTGVCAMDNANYPDCTPQFVFAAERTMREALGMHRPDYNGPALHIKTPLILLTKQQTVELAFNFPKSYEALAYSHTCYAGEVPPCGKCHACVLRAEGFKQAGVADPLVNRFGGADA